MIVRHRPLLSFLWPTGHPRSGAFKIAVGLACNVGPFWTGDRAGGMVVVEVFEVFLPAFDTPISNKVNNSNVNKTLR